MNRRVQKFLKKHNLQCPKRMTRVPLKQGRRYRRRRRRHRRLRRCRRRRRRRRRPLHRRRCRRRRRRSLRRRRRQKTTALQCPAQICPKRILAKNTPSLSPSHFTAHAQKNVPFFSARLVGRSTVFQHGALFTRGRTKGRQGRNGRLKEKRNLV